MCTSCLALGFTIGDLRSQLEVHDGKAVQRQPPHTGLAPPLKGNKGQNQYLNRVFIGKIPITLRKWVLYPDKVNFEISCLKVGIRSLDWDHYDRNPDKRS